METVFQSCIMIVNKSSSDNEVPELIPNPVPARLTIFQTGRHDAWATATNPNYREKEEKIYKWSR